MTKNWYFCHGDRIIHFVRYGCYHYYVQKFVRGNWTPLVRCHRQLLNYCLDSYTEWGEI